MFLDNFSLPSNQISVFKPDQTESTTDNSGEFSAEEEKKYAEIEINLNNSNEEEIEGGERECFKWL